MPRYIKEVNTPWYTTLTNALGRIILQLIVFITFIGILPITVLIFYKVFVGDYLEALVNCGILLSIIKANKSVQ